MKTRYIQRDFVLKSAVSLKFSCNRGLRTGD